PALFHRAGSAASRSGWRDTIHCRAAVRQAPHIVRHRREAGMLLTTTSTLQDRRIDEYKGGVSGEAILGANAFRDMVAGIRDIVGGRSAAYERELQRAKDLAMSEMAERARETGANAVIGIDLDYETVGQNGSMLMVTASGTAVVVA